MGEGVDTLIIKISLFGCYGGYNGDMGVLAMFIRCKATLLKHSHYKGASLLEGARIVCIFYQKWGIYPYST